MLYFVGFYVLLLFDIVLCIQVENLTAITASEQTMAAYLQNSFFSAGYLMAASIVALKCLNLVPVSYTHLLIVHKTFHINEKNECKDVYLKHIHSNRFVYGYPLSLIHI